MNAICVVFFRLLAFYYFIQLIIQLPFLAYWINSPDVWIEHDTYYWVGASMLVMNILLIALLWFAGKTARCLHLSWTSATSFSANFSKSNRAYWYFFNWCMARWQWPARINQ